MKHPTVSGPQARARGRLKLAGPVLVTAAVVAVVWVGAGDLNPPSGAIMPTDRTTINGQVVTLPYTISTPGSYVLTSNITGVSGQHGIIIDADDVTLDLNGFTLIGVPGSLDGVTVPVSLTTNLAVRNGTVRDWGGDGVDASNAQNSQLENLRVSGNGGDGLRGGDGCIVRNCTAEDNSGDGIRLSEAGTITGCVAVGNARGISLRSGTVTNCAARNNNSTGISASDAAVIDGCVSEGSINGDGIFAGVGSIVKNCSAVSNGDDGIVISFGGEVRGCTCINNDGDGIHAGFDSLIIGNTCSKNTVGIDLGGRRSRIEGNNVLENGTGIGGVGIKNLIIKNSAGRNSPNYNISADNAVGEIIDVTGTAGIPFSSGSPWANFVHEPELP